MPEKPTEPTVVIDGHDNGHPFNNPDAVALLDAYAESSTVFYEYAQTERLTAHAAGHWSVVDAVKFLRQESHAGLKHAHDFVKAYVRFCALRGYPAVVVKHYESLDERFKEVYDLLLFP